MPRTIVYQTGAHDLARQLFGRVVTDETLACAVGALEGAEVTFSVRREWLLVEIRHPYIESQERSIRRDGAGKLFIYNHEFTKRASAPAGTRDFTGSFANQPHAQRNNVERGKRQMVETSGK